ncbi:hypothetical protein ZWY2020_002854 [Hordeum vulgare]|nr:hypothetical protein ZWY2020_002854 [Hordeum vulgare]
MASPHHLSCAAHQRYHGRPPCTFITFVARRATAPLEAAPTFTPGQAGLAYKALRLAGSLRRAGPACSTASPHHAAALLHALRAAVSTTVHAGCSRLHPSLPARALLQPGPVLPSPRV